MTEPYPQTPDDSLDWLNNQAYNAENERLKKDNRMLREMVDRLKKKNEELREGWEKSSDFFADAVNTIASMTSEIEALQELIPENE